MRHVIRSPEDLGQVIRAVRKSTSLRQDDMAAAVGVSRQFAVDAERGKPTVQLGKVLQLLHELGIELSARIPEEASRSLAALQERPRRPREIPAPGGSRHGPTESGGQ